MRLTPAQRHSIRQTVDRLTGGQGDVWLFGPCTDAEVPGDDIELLLECPGAVDDPAQLAAELRVQLAAALGPRRIAVLLWAPNLQEQPAHCVARATGVLL